MIGIGLGLTNIGKSGPPLYPPVNTVAPVISGTATEGQTQSSTQGTWSPPGDTYAYQWKRDGANISGATSTTYVLVLADVGALITCTVTATNADGSASATSNSLGPVAAAPTGPTYADFANYVNANSADGERAWSTGLGNTTGTFRTTAAAETGTMFGTSWGDFFLGAVCRIVQHGLPSQPEFNSQIAQGALIRFITVEQGNNDLTGLNRNGYMSNSATEAASGSCAVLEYWDFATSEAKRMNPLAQTGPVVFTLPGF